MTMLDRMRRHKNWLKWSLVLVVLAFIALYIPASNNPANGAGLSGAVATVEGNDITVAPLDHITRSLQALGAGKAKVRVEFDSAPAALVNALSGATIEKAADPCQLPKAIKTKAELDGTRAAHLRDGVAVTRFLAWLENASARGDVLTEMGVTDKLFNFRREGALFKGGKTVAYYRTSGASFGLQAGAQTYGYAMFFMNEKALQALDQASGFEVGVGPSVVVMDEGMAKSSTTTTMKDDIYAFIFGQKGLMAGLGIQGNKIAKINPK